MIGKSTYGFEYKQLLHSHMYHLLCLSCCKWMYTMVFGEARTPARLLSMA